ncbi:hypothetical protein H072_5903 [Dactylellina haptotyla CBS 200.50]|uniref:Uncharacterized protein n=1 Tax=Dactylellina haptotyla (strain CBS 200.50) TaxID=1284197 RepID=S8ABK9_DACHA|nr:hypothetical protein H072_5903 [Dactylellina haptotyla CBS 200.50]
MSTEKQKGARAKLQNATDKQEKESEKQEGNNALSSTEFLLPDTSVYRLASGIGLARPGWRKPLPFTPQRRHRPTRVSLISACNKFAKTAARSSRLDLRPSRYSTQPKQIHALFRSRQALLGKAPW